MSQLFKYEFPAMGGDCSLLLYAAQENVAERAAEAAMVEVWRIEAAYSRYRDDNALAEINRAALQGATIEVNEETAGLLDYAFACYRKSNGLFDVSSGILRKVWDFTSSCLPEQEKLALLLPQIGLDKIIWQVPQLSFPISGMELDFGGIGKEYAADRVADICHAMRIESGLIDLGGDICVLGPHPDGSAWQIGIRHPRNQEASLRTLSIMSGAVATSGDYERYIEVDGKRYCHILNPLTGWPTEGLSSVTVLADQCLVAGSLATIAMLKGTTGPDWLSRLGVLHLWMDDTQKHGGILEGTADI
jgi:thiamine biosynthesis lipoprotein